MNIIYLVKLNHLCNCNTLGSQMIRLEVGGFRGRYDWGICANFWKLIVGRVWFAEERDNIQIRKGQLQFTDCGFNKMLKLCGIKTRSTIQFLLKVSCNVAKCFTWCDGYSLLFNISSGILMVYDKGFKYLFSY